MKITTRQITQISLMAALVYVGTMLGIRIPIGGSETMLHFGNVFCLLAGLLFGGIPGGLAAGIGSGIFDLLGGFAAESWITFINKFLMAFVAGSIVVYGKNRIKNNLFRTTIAAICGSLTYTILYTIKNIIESRFVQGLPWSGVWAVISVKLPVSLTNGVVAVIVSLVIYFAIKPALTKANLIKTV